MSLKCGVYSLKCPVYYSFTWENLDAIIQILHICDEGLKINYRESIKYLKIKIKILNDKADLIHSPIFGIIAPHCVS